MSGRHAAEHAETGDPLANDVARHIVNLNAAAKALAGRKADAGKVLEGVAADLVTLLDRHVKGSG